MMVYIWAHTDNGKLAKLHYVVNMLIGLCAQDVHVFPPVAIVKVGVIERFNVAIIVVHAARKAQGG
jgi:hypothetical protein